MSRLLLWFVEGVGIVLATLAIAVVLLAFRLVAAPLDIDFLTPQVKAWIDARVDPYTVSIGKTRLRWQAGHSTIDVEAADFGLHAPLTTAPVLKADTLRFSLSLRPLLHKRFQPTRMTLEGGRLDLVHYPDHRFGLAGTPHTNQPQTDETVSREAITRVLDQLSGSASANGAKRTETLARLDRVVIDSAMIDVDDQAFGTQWSLDKANLAFQRTAIGWALHVDALGGAGTAHSQLSATGSYSANDQHLQFSATVGSLNPANWVANIQRPPSELVPLAGLNVPLKSQVDGSADFSKWNLGPVRLSLSGGSGSVTDPRFAGGVLPLAGFELAAHYDPAARNAEIDHARLDLDGPIIEFRGYATQLPIIFREALTQPVPMVFDVTLNNFPESRFDGLWPLGAAPDARGWVLDHLSKGKIDELKAHLEPTWQPQISNIVMNAVTGSMKLTGFTIDYLPGLTRAQGVDATATFSRQGFDFVLEKGRINDLTITQGKASIQALDHPQQDLSIDLPMSGPIKEIVELLAMDRLKIAQRAGLSPDGIAGQADGLLHFDFPLLKDLPLAKLNYSANARLTGAVVPKVALSRDLTEGKLQLALNPALLSVTGEALLDGNPAHLAWSQRVSGPSRDKMHAKVQITLDTPSRVRLGLDVLPENVSGPVGVDVDYISRDGGSSQADLVLDLSPATLTVSELDWLKASGAAAHARLSVILQNDKVTDIKGLQVDAPDLLARGDLAFSNQNLLSLARIDQLEIAGNQVHGQITRSDAGWDVRLGGARIDLTTYLKGLKNSKPTDEDKRPPLHAVLQADTLIVGKDRSLDHAALDAQLLKGSLDTLTLSGGIGQGKHAAITMGSPNGAGVLLITSDDLGDFLKVIGIAQNIRGGSLKVTGENHRKDGVRTFTAHIEGHDYRLFNAPVIARLLTVSSPTSIVSLLTGNGIPFDVLLGDLTLRNGLVTVDNARAHGNALGLTAAGTLDLKAGTIDLSGTVVPAYLLNGSLGKVPILGDLLTGGAGKGLFAANYSLGGSLSHIDVSVNPLSVLAPGFLRDFFLFSAGHPASQAAPKTQ